MKKFIAVAANNFVSGLASALVWFSVTIWAYLQTHSVLVTSILSGVHLIGMIASSLFFGSIVDHHKKKSVMLGADLASALSFLAAYGFYASVPEVIFQDVSEPRLWIFLALLYSGVIISNIRSITLPTLASFLLDESHRDKGNGIAGTLNGLTFLIAPMIGGFLIAYSGMTHILLLALLLRFITIVHLLLTHLEGDTVAHHEEHKKKLDLKGTLKLIRSIPGLLALLFFNSINNFLGGVFMPLIDPYGLSFVDQKVWGVISGLLSIGFIMGGLFVAKWGLGKNPLKRLLLMDLVLWSTTIFFAIQPSLVLLLMGIFVYFCGMPIIEAGEQSIIQKLVPKERQGRVFGFAQSMESAASPISALAIGPLAQFFFIPFMTTGKGVEWIGAWFGTGDARGIGLVFTVAGILGTLLTLLALNSKSYKLLSRFYSRAHSSVG